VKLLLLAFVLCAAAGAQTIHVTGSLQSQKTARINFGKLPKQYRVADWTVTNESASVVRVSLARVLQELPALPGMTVLSRTSSTSVVEDSQGASTLNTVTRVGTAVIGAVSAATALQALPNNRTGSAILLGGELASLAISFVFPALHSHAVRSIGDMLPETISLDPMGTQSGMVILEVIGKPTAGFAAVQTLDTEITLKGK
jgi:hypothetical protein